jgi:hypothetical protein
MVEDGVMHPPERIDARAGGDAFRGRRRGERMRVNLREWEIPEDEPYPRSSSSLDATIFRDHEKQDSGGVDKEETRPAHDAQHGGVASWAAQDRAHALPVLE